MHHPCQRQSTPASSIRRDILILIVARLSSRSSRYTRRNFKPPMSFSGAPVVPACRKTAGVDYCAIRGAMRSSMPTVIAPQLATLVKSPRARVQQLARKLALQQLLNGAADPIRYRQHFDLSGAACLESACKLGVEGIVSKGRPARSSRAGARRGSSSSAPGDRNSSWAATPIRKAAV